jgi:hypothetical protein
VISAQAHGIHITMNPYEFSGRWACWQTMETRTAEQMRDNDFSYRLHVLPPKMAELLEIKVGNAVAKGEKPEKAFNRVWKEVVGVPISRQTAEETLASQHKVADELLTSKNIPFETTWSLEKKQHILAHPEQAFATQEEDAARQLEELRRGRAYESGDDEDDADDESDDGDGDEDEGDDAEAAAKATPKRATARGGRNRR